MTAQLALFAPFLKASFQDKPCRHRVQDESADASALSLGRNPNPFGFFSGAAHQ